MTRPDPDPQAACRAIARASRSEPYARHMGLRLLDVEPGGCRVEMVPTPEMTNLFGTVHGGALFSLLDEAFQIACNSHGVTAFALNLSVTYVNAARPGERLVAEAREVALTRRTATYHIRVVREDGEVVAAAQALAYRKGTPVPFLDEEGKGD
ncbi:PaaI family thioesterase [Deferrisoma sp.]